MMRSPTAWGKNSTTSFWDAGACTHPGVPLFKSAAGAWGEHLPQPGAECAAWTKPALDVAKLAPTCPRPRLLVAVNGAADVGEVALHRAGARAGGGPQPGVTNRCAGGTTAVDIGRSLQVQPAFSACTMLSPFG